MLQGVDASALGAGDHQAQGPVDISCFWQAAETADDGAGQADADPMRRCRGPLGQAHPDDRIVIRIPVEALVHDPVRQRASIAGFGPDGPLLFPGAVQDVLRSQASNRAIGGMSWYGLWFVNLGPPEVRFIDGLCQPDYRWSDADQTLSIPLDPDLGVDLEGNLQIDLVVRLEAPVAESGGKTCAIGAYINDRMAYRQAVLTGQAPLLSAGNLTFFAHVRLLGVILRQDGRALWTGKVSGRDAGDQVAVFQ